MDVEGRAQVVALGGVGAVVEALYNPALVGSEERSVGASYRMLSLDRVVYEVGYFQPLEPDGGMGLLWHRASTSVQGRNVEGRRTETLGVAEYAFGLALGLRVWRGVYGGLAGWVFGRELAGQRGGGFGLDLGVIWKGGKGAFGLAVQHLGASVSLRDRYWKRERSSRDRIPTVVRLGGMWRLGRAGLYGEAVRSRRRTEVRVGVEWEVSSTFVVRAGVRDLGRNSDRSIRGGFGLRFPRMSVGYAFATDPMGAEASHGLSTEFFF